MTFSVFEYTRIRTTYTKSTSNGSLLDGSNVAQSLRANDLKVAIIFAEGLLTNGEELLQGFESILPDVTVS